MGFTFLQVFEKLLERSAMEDLELVVVVAA